MPNLCNNKVVVTGTKTEISKFKKLVSSNDSHFSFEAILPMPLPLRGTASPTLIVSQEEYDKWMKSAHEERKQAEMSKDYSIDMESLAGRPLTKELSTLYLVDYGNDNWYDWAYDNWGTKWDLDEDELQYSEEPTQLTYKFETAWNPPYGIYEELVNKFPKLHIDWRYEEEGMDLFGNLANEELPNREPAREMQARIETLLTGMSKSKVG